MEEGPGDISRLLERWSGGDRAAFQELIPVVYDETATPGESLSAKRTRRSHVAKHSSGPWGVMCALSMPRASAGMGGRTSLPSPPRACGASWWTMRASIRPASAGREPGKRPSRRLSPYRSSQALISRRSMKLSTVRHLRPPQIPRGGTTILRRLVDGRDFGGAGHLGCRGEKRLGGCKSLAVPAADHRADHLAVETTVPGGRTGTPGHLSSGTAGGVADTCAARQDPGRHASKTERRFDALELP
jgi:hypothetical protein